MVREAAAAYEHLLGSVPAVHPTPPEARVRMALEAILRQAADSSTPDTCSTGMDSQPLLCRAAVHLKALQDVKAHLAEVQSQLHAALDELHDRRTAPRTAAARDTGSSSAHHSAARPPQPEVSLVLSPAVGATPSRQQWEPSSPPVTTPGALAATASISPFAPSSAASSARTVIIKDGDEDDATCDSSTTAATAAANNSDRSSGGRYEQFKQCPQHLLAAELALASPRLLGRRRRDAPAGACSSRAAAAVRSLFLISGSAAVGDAGGGAGSSAAFDPISLGSVQPIRQSGGCQAAAASSAGSRGRHQRHAAIAYEEADEGCEELQQDYRQLPPFARAGGVRYDLIARDVCHPAAAGHHLDLFGLSRPSAAGSSPRNSSSSSSSSSGQPQLQQSQESAISLLLPGGGVLPANYRMTPAAAAWFESLRQRAAGAKAAAGSQAASPAVTKSSSRRVDLVAADPFQQPEPDADAAEARLSYHQLQPCQAGSPPPPPPPAYEECWQHATIIGGRSNDNCCGTGDVDAHTGSGGAWTVHNTASGYCTPFTPAAGVTGAAGGMAACGAAAHLQLDNYGCFWEQAAAEEEDFDGFTDIPLSGGRGAATSSHRGGAWHTQQEEQGQRPQYGMEALLAEGAGNAYGTESVDGVPFTYYTKAIFTPR
ncbi:hypothetical protein HXX76_015298 [Chlamydomonas incerta]|uniref:Uncharacterized protein n=1 Tax=Chlamydomonas incerta TaxID=51695 RepID=A0A835S9Z4_CHLIN|nr:hypothetical protein HXX76_015298 [Chlamydomonas incerta]|eukprot:KAG2423427.1 hypothetical protein HXX76_015298 [Chlamydomonas incerta]